MGLIKKIFGLLGAVFGLLAGLVGGLAKLVGLGKSDYYLELDDAKGQPAASAQADPKPEPKAAASAVKAAVADPAPAQMQASQNGATPAPMKAAPKPAPASANGASVGGQSATTFAPEFLLTLSNTGSRRRPGPSLSPFKDMARQMKQSSRGA